MGEIGYVTHIEGYWHRNSDWRRPVADPSLEKLVNWRLYRRWSLGLIAELGSHQIDIANWVFGDAPLSALGSGSICRYHDGRETDDNVQVVLEYSKGRRFTFSSVSRKRLNESTAPRRLPLQRVPLTGLRERCLIADRENRWM